MNTVDEDLFFWGTLDARDGQCGPINACNVDVRWWDVGQGNSCMP